MSRNITFDLAGHAESRPAAPALLLPGRTISYRELDSLVWRHARQLHELGVRPGQVVGLSFSDELGLVLTLLALGRLGATSHSIPRSATAIERRQMAARARLSWLASDQPERHDSGVPGLRLTRQAIERLAPADPGLMDEEPAAPWLLISGSGSTGSPRLIPLTHAQARARAVLGASSLRLTPNDRVAALSHFDFAHSKYRLLEALTTGAACALQAWQGGIHSPRQWLAYRLSVVYGTVFHAAALLEQADERTPRLLAGLRAFELSASPISHGLRQRVIRQLTPQLHVRYGSNETGPISMAGPSDLPGWPATVGRPLDGTRVRIVDRRLQPLPPGTVGLIQVGSPGLVDGYREDDDASAASFSAEGFLPGDLGQLTADGQLLHFGRADQMMIVNGINLYPAEIEQLMCDHPDIGDAIALPLRHPIHHDIPVCAVARRPGRAIGEPALLEYAREHLGARAPRRIAVVDELPRTAGGKIRRDEIAGLFTGPAGAAAGKPYRQRMRRIRHLFELEARADPVGLAAWLAATVGSAHEPVALPAVCEAAAEPARAWLEQALLLARWLLQAGRIPVLDRPRLLALAAPARASGWQAEIAFGEVDLLPDAVYHEALDSAVTLCRQADAAGRPTMASLQQFYSRADQARQRLGQRMPGGKSTLPLLRAAHGLRIPFTHLGAGMFQLGWGSRACRVDCGSSGIDSAIGARLASSKPDTARLLRLAGLPAPEHRLVIRLSAALAAAHEIGWPVVVKPADRERGEGVTLDVRDEAGLRTAFAIAQRLSPARQVLVERQVPGWCHRLVIARGKLLYAVKRLPISVSADGRHSIAELVDAELHAQQRLPPWARSMLPLDALALAALASAGLRADSVPPAGVRVDLRRIESTAWGGVDEEVSALVHPENLRVAIEATRLIGLDIAGVDLITPDISRPWFENGAILNEINHSPQLGGGEISRRHLPDLLAQWLPEGGQIPVELFVGGAAAWAAASLRWQRLLGQGVNAWISSATLTLGPSGQPRPMPWNGCYRRARALLLSADVAALVLAVPTAEWASQAPPFESVDRIVHQDMPRPPAA